VFENVIKYESLGHVNSFIVFTIVLHQNNFQLLYLIKKRIVMFTYKIRNREGQGNRTLEDDTEHTINSIPSLFLN
jgi:hypothetical protein